MRKKLSIFKDEQITNKYELLYSLSKFKEHFEATDNEENYSKRKTESLIRNIKEFVDIVERVALPELDNWWYYDYRIDNFGIRLDMCYCDEIEYNDEGYIDSMSSSAVYELISHKCKMLTVNEFALLHKVKPMTVRQWIRRGKLRLIKKQGRDWYISEFSDIPSRKYEPVNYYWKSGRIWPEDFSYLNDYNCIYICQNKDSKNLFEIILGWPGTNNRKKLEITKSEREKLELFLLSDNDVIVEELSSGIQFCPPKEYTEPLIKEKKKSKKKQESEYLYYGEVLIKKGPHKGRIGYYDDDEGDEAIIYFGHPYITDKYHIIPQKYITGMIPTISLTTRMGEIFKEINIYKNNEFSQKELLREYILCSNLLNERYIKSMNMITENKDIQIFVSHATKDSYFAKALATDLMDANYKVFLDDRSIDIGDRIHEKINDNLENCNALVMIISKNYLESTYCSDEWSAFYKKATSNKNNLIYPIIIDDSEPPALISTLKYARIKSEDDYESNLEKLLKALKKHYN